MVRVPDPAIPWRLQPGRQFSGNSSAVLPFDAVRLGLLTDLGTVQRAWRPPRNGCRASSIRVQEDDRLLRVLDVCVVAEPWQGHHGDTQPGKLPVGVHGVVLAAGQRHRGLAPG